MGKYAPLVNHLSQATTNSVRLTFAEIERILGEGLPPSAYKHHAFWSNADRGTNGWSNLWKRAGWVRADYDLSGKWVRFERTEHYSPDSDKALEGYAIDRTILTRTRNAGLALRRKQMDKYRCQVCSFHFELQGSYVIDVHHLNPLAQGAATATKIEQLVSLCPTCHRIAHLRNPPYAIDELKQLRQIMGKQIKNRYNGTSDYEKFLLGADYSKQKIFDLESDTPVPIKAPTLNKSDIKSTHMFDFDMNHTIQPETSKFDDIKFE